MTYKCNACGRESEEKEICCDAEMQEKTEGEENASSDENGESELSE